MSSSWRVLELSEQPDGEPIPQLLVKPAFKAHSYCVFLTCLTNIWCEELDLAGIVDRAVEQQSPIEVSTQDTAQLAILLETVEQSLSGSDTAECRITREGIDGITLHTTVRLPEPLDSLTWKFHLRKRSPVTLKNELILPLLVSSHIQYERINDLITTIENKDSAITRLVDSFESNNLDLAAAFPSIGGLKTGRKLIKREQAARHLPALRPFQQLAWREETAQLADSDVTTLGLFQEALAQCAPDVPSSLRAEDGAEDWLPAVPSRLTYAKPAVKIRTIEPAPRFQPPKHGHESSPVDDDTEDEFEVHRNFKTRSIPQKVAKAPEPPLPSAHLSMGAEDEESTEDDDDLDVPGRSQSQGHGSRQTRPPSPPIPSEPATSPPPASKPKGKGFRIGGKAKKETPETSQSEEKETVTNHDSKEASMPPPSQVDLQVEESPKKPRKQFRIGGKSKPIREASSSQCEPAEPPISNRHRDTYSPTPKSSPPPLPQELREETAPAEEAHEETPEEKAERKRAELKRRNEEIAKKQAQHKKKKRF
ncbi:XRCC4-like factor-domain-containing protein [Boeremia exigua]|uniref:XRCC4-like factor-domain-containing protein n=1 Tax=Boeremia exigua TaxID=749465 RepID=UPI001E8CE3FB|nr:XRCC4-like factor-domain-containing protein [Boeremia exigua]KAH6639138.1 XRCC4-like factor-domain-containing protein [Boeremia exigua]